MEKLTGIPLGVVEESLLDNEGRSVESLWSEEEITRAMLRRLNTDVFNETAHAVYHTTELGSESVELLKYHDLKDPPRFALVPSNDFLAFAADDTAERLKNVTSKLEAHFRGGITQCPAHQARTKTSNDLPARVFNESIKLYMYVFNSLRMRD